MRKPPPSASPPKESLDSSGLGGADSLAELYDRYAPQVERWARRLAGPRFDPEDLLHDIFLIVLRRRHEFRGEAKMTTWLFRITAQVVRWRRRNAALRSWLWGLHGQSLAEAKLGPTPVEDLERREEGMRLYAALDRLPEKYRSVLILFALDEATGDQIAALLGIDTNTVWVRLHRARAKLADLLTEGEPSP
jgi:RNA polymerase sigma-70 factor (ECF subfamily)